MQIAVIPSPVQNALFAALAPIAHARGYKGKYEEYLTRPPNATVEPEPLPGSVEQP